MRRWTDRIDDRNIWLIYWAIFLLGIGYGVSIALTALHLDARGYTKQNIATLASWFASGIILFSIPMGAILRRFTAKRTLAVSLFGYAVCVTAFPLFHSYAGIALARFFDGAFSVGIWVSCETILLTRADKKNKAFVMSLYAMAMAIGYILGPIAARVIVVVASMQAAFATSGVISTFAALLVLMKLDQDLAQTPEERSKNLSTTTAWTLLHSIKTSCFATFAYGYFQVSVVLFLPLFLIESKGITRDQTILIPAFFAVGMLLFSNVAGRLGDRFGHLLLMRVLSAIGTLMIVGFVVLSSYAAMCGAVFVAGATLATISPVSLALQGVIVQPQDYSRSNAIYNVFYAAGMLMGPLASSYIFASSGGRAMLVHLAIMWTAFVLFTWVFANDDPRRLAARSLTSALAAREAGP